MTREDIIEGLNKVENELYLKHGDEDLANQIHNISEALRLNQLSLPPAENAEEILQKYMDMSMIICPLHVVPRSVAIDAMHEFATLHTLISEGYYPKEFVEWLVKNSLPNDNELLIRTNLTKTEYMTYDEAFNYWKENEQ